MHPCSCQYRQILLLQPTVINVSKLKLCYVNGNNEHQHGPPLQIKVKYKKIKAEKQIK